MNGRSMSSSDAWAKVFGRRSADRDRACEILREAGFNVSKLTAPELSVPEARVGGSVYRGVQQIRELAGEAGR